MAVEERSATVVVIGGGQAGLSAAHHLQHRGFASALTSSPPASALTSSPPASALASSLPASALASSPPTSGLAAPTSASVRTFVVLDAAEAPGGAWTHRWESLHMATVNGIFDLPGSVQRAPDPDEPSRIAVPRYFAAYEAEHAFPLLRPVRVTAVRRAHDADPSAPFLVESTAGPWRADFVINAAGTWENPVLPHYPGAETFLGRQLHTRDYRSLDEFHGQRVAVVGGGISAVQQLEEISRVATTLWYTRREPVFHDGPFERETLGRSTVAAVAAEVEAGRPSRSVVSYTGLVWTPYALAARDRGALHRRPMFTAIEPHGVREADGSFTSVDTILWATGFRPSLAHLDPLDLRTAAGGIAVDGTRVRAEPRLHLIGFGPSQSTVGANRAGRDAVAAIARDLAPAPASAPAPALARAATPPSPPAGAATPPSPPAPPSAGQGVAVQATVG